MNCVLFAQTDQIFSKKKLLTKYIKNVKKKHGKSQGKFRGFCQSRKVGTMTGPNKFQLAD